VFTVDAYLFDFEDIDMVLGMSWLGEMIIVWKKQIVKIETPQGFKVFNEVSREEKKHCVLLSVE